jgi:hypothetical protein
MKNIYQLIMLMTISSMALADGNVMPMKVPEKVKSECASCHMVYPPAFLPKESWTTIMSGLEKHYGTDASLDPQSIKEISQWLNQYAGTYKRVSSAPPNDRITESTWFIKKHRKITDSTWRNSQVKSKSNCMVAMTTMM